MKKDIDINQRISKVTAATYRLWSRKKNQFLGNTVALKDGMMQGHGSLRGLTSFWNLAKKQDVSVFCNLFLLNPH